MGTDKPPYQVGDTARGLLNAGGQGTVLAPGTVVACELQPPFICNWCTLHLTPPPDGTGLHTPGCECWCHDIQPPRWTVTLAITLNGERIEESYRNVRADGEGDSLLPGAG